MDDDSDSDIETPRMSPRLARRIERACCNFITYLPLIFVYGITSWAAWVIVSIGSNPPKDSWLGMPPMAPLFLASPILVYS